MIKLSLALAMLVLFVQCGGDSVSTTGDLVGGSCGDDRDCEEDCVRTGDFPEGMCTVVCSVDEHCPSGTYCIDKEGGICALGCEVPGDCRPGYTCEGVNNRGHDGDSLVCIDD
jgi:hypothetical protein